MRKMWLMLAVMGVLGCQHEKESPQPATGSGSAASGSAGSGSAAVATGSGSGSAASGSATVATGSGSGSAGSGSAEENTGAFDFDKLSQEDKMKFMRTKMVPAMKVTFQAFDAKKYANFGCKTCHGKDPQKTKYKMPNPELPPLDFKLLEQGKQKPNVAEWMSKTVKPQVAQILERPQMSKEHPDGFGCLECHTEKK